MIIESKHIPTELPLIDKKTDTVVGDTIVGNLIIQETNIKGSEADISDTKKSSTSVSQHTPLDLTPIKNNNSSNDVLDLTHANSNLEEDENNDVNDDDEVIVIETVNEIEASCSHSNNNSSSQPNSDNYAFTHSNNIPSRLHDEDIPDSSTSKDYDDDEYDEDGVIMKEFEKSTFFSVKNSQMSTYGTQRKLFRKASENYVLAKKPQPNIDHITIDYQYVPNNDPRHPSFSFFFDVEPDYVVNYILDYLPMEDINNLTYTCSTLIFITLLNTIHISFKLRCYSLTY